MKRIVLNKKGMLLFSILTIVALILLMLECDSMLLYIATKILAIIDMAIINKLCKYIPSKYL